MASDVLLISGKLQNNRVLFEAAHVFKTVLMK
jgi:hypothetical protein